MTGVEGVHMVFDGWLQVPVGGPSDRWVTRPGLRNILVVAHSATALQRLLDVTAVFESDPRVQTVFAVGESAFSHPVPEMLRALQAAVVPWEQAIRTPFDLVLASGYSGLHQFQAPVLTVAHGAGHNKMVFNANADPALYGMGPQQLVRSGRLVVSTLGLSHSAELDILKEQCPAALPSAAVVGDPCFDRIIASRPRREEYRRSLGIEDGRKLTVACSTWGRHSLFGSRFDVIDRLVQNAKAEGGRMALLLHPAVWHGHGPRQVRAWLRAQRDNGLIVVEPDQEWRSVLVAADRAVGDHGSTSLYAVAAGAAFIQVQFPSELISPGSPMDLLRAVAPKWSDAKSPAEQFTAVELIQNQQVDGAIVDRITSQPGMSAQLLRQVVYGHLALTEPKARAATESVPLPLTSMYPFA